MAGVMTRTAYARARSSSSARTVSGPIRWIWRTAVGAALAIAVGACAPVQHTVGEWTLIQASPCAGDPAVDSAFALDRAQHHLREMASPFRRHDPGDMDAGEPLLACGLRRAQHSASWSYHADDRDIWLLSFWEDDELDALAAIDAGTGTVLAVTYGVWAGAVDR